MTTRNKGSIRLTIALGLASTTAFASPVHIEVAQGRSTIYGAGFSVSNGDSCFVVTPKHVVETAQSNEITVTDGQGQKAKAEVVKLAPADDAALLKLSSNGAFDCAQPWADGMEAATAIRKAKWLIARHVDADGGIQQTRWFVANAGRELLALQPFSDKDALRKGDSGSALYADDVLVGMIVASDTKDANISAIPQAQLFSLFNNDLTAPKERVALLEPITFRNQPDTYATYAAREYLTKNTPLSVSEAPMSARGAPGRLPNAEPAVPEGVDFVVSGTIVEITQRQIANPNYKPNAQAQFNSASFGNKLLKSLSNTVLNKNETAPYLLVIDVDVEINVTDVKKHSVGRDLERRSIQVANDGTPRTDLQQNAVQNAVTQAMDATFRKYGLPMRKK
jgi:hypothetical protein